MKYRREIRAAVLFVLIVLAAVLFLTAFSRNSAERETRMVKDAVRSAVINCYAVEGAYPENLSYLRENYGLAYDEERYTVFYDYFASNQFPDIRVAERQVGGR